MSVLSKILGPKHARRPSVGAYRLIRGEPVQLDRRQKRGVQTFYAELVERNKYAPGWPTRGKHL